MVLLRVEFTLLQTVASRTVRSYRTLSPLPDPLRAIGGLLSAALVVGLRPQALPGTLLYGARTFLPLISLPNTRLRDVNKAATTQSTPGANSIGIAGHCLGRIVLHTDFWRNWPEIQQLAEILQSPFVERVLFQVVNFCRYRRRFLQWQFLGQNTKRA